jgi:hypothetical protein
MSREIQAEHGIVCRLPDEKLGYFAWPSVTRLDDGALAVASSGLRSQHICPWGKTVLNISYDNGYTWSEPRVINDSPLDDRDAGVVDLGESRLLVTWFSTDNRRWVLDEGVIRWLGMEEINSWKPTLADITDEMADRYTGSWVRLSTDRGATWSAPLRAPVSTPHGPIRLRSGDLIYLGKPFITRSDLELAPITAARSLDGGHTWQIVGKVPAYPGTDPANYHEPHLVELPSGRLLGMVRIEDAAEKKLAASGIPSFSMMQTESDDGGKNWTVAHPLGFHGSPPHLLRHSSGTIILTYGFRQEPFGQRLAFSLDEGATWQHDWILRADGLDCDLGYPSSVELPGGELFTVCYQRLAGDSRCSLLWSRWRLPDL